MNLGASINAILWVVFFLFSYMVVKELCSWQVHFGSSYLFLILVFAFQVTVYQCLEGGVIAVLQSYIDEDVRTF